MCMLSVSCIVCNMSLSKPKQTKKKKHNKKMVRHDLGSNHLIFMGGLGRNSEKNFQDQKFGEKNYQDRRSLKKNNQDDIYEANYFY